MSPSGSVELADAESVSSVCGAACVIETLSRVGAESATTRAPETTGVELAAPSPAVTRTVIESPLSPLPRTERSSVAPVSPAMSTPFRRHW